MKKKINLALLFSICLLVTNSVLAYTCPNGLEYVGCGSGSNAVTGIPVAVPQLISFSITLMKVIIPVALIITGTIEMFKSIIAGNPDNIPKGKKKIINKFVAALLAFFVISFTTNIVKLIARSNEKSTIASCLSCYLNNKCTNDESVCKDTAGYIEPEQYTPEKLRQKVEVGLQDLGKISNTMQQLIVALASDIDTEKTPITPAGTAQQGTTQQGSSGSEIDCSKYPEGDARDACMTDHGYKKPSTTTTVEEIDCSKYTYEYARHQCEETKRKVEVDCTVLTDEIERNNCVHKYYGYKINEVMQYGPKIEKTF